jgi:mono/diheme cytochrome c family protein
MRFPCFTSTYRVGVLLLLLNPGNNCMAQLSWDSLEKQCKASFPEQVAKVQFTCTNTHSTPVTILRIRPSCGCMTRSQGTLPMRIPPGASEVLRFEVDLQGKSGSLFKQVEIFTEQGEVVLKVGILISQRSNFQDRMVNLKIAEGNRQAVFKGECAACHAFPTKGKLGKELFASACGICHMAEPRASMVPDLRAIPGKRDAAWWRALITDGKPGTLMPGFAEAKRGPLTEAQIESLIQFFSEGGPLATPASGHSK